ncbi:MAG: uroporphyrinogen decarboxylase [Nitrososphaerales archaeon]|nr:uroporphyrinogen decarboxylase [Nitrososphaerales archaeon]
MSAFVDACLGKETAYTPVWFMRQAGRYLPSYRKAKGSRSVIEMAKNPELASQLVVDAVGELGVDAGIIFADIMLPLEGLGVNFRIEENVGPIVSNPIRSAEGVRALGEFQPKRDVGFVYDAIDATVRKLDGTPLIGFSGAPFTLAGYVVEGAPSRELQKTKAMMYGDPETWDLLMRKLTSMVKLYLGEQIRHGVQAVQLFDSWVGCLSPSDYARYVMPYTREIFGSIGGRVPKIHFCANSASLLEQFCEAGADVLSVDWRMRIGEVWKRCNERVGVQGNLDPVVALAGGEALRAGVDEILKDASLRSGHIFSLGHGVLRETPPENLKRIVRMVHEQTRRKR